MLGIIGYSKPFPINWYPTHPYTPFKITAGSLNLKEKLKSDMSFSDVSQVLGCLRMIMNRVWGHVAYFWIVQGMVYPMVISMGG